jgi:hypothetical protein
MPNLSQSENPAPRRCAGCDFSAANTRSPLEKKSEPIRRLRPSDLWINTLTLVLLAAVMLAGCASTGLPLSYVDDEDAGLHPWVDEELAPYLMDQLGRQPRFRDEPVLLVAMNGADIRPDIDELTRNLRARMLDHLLVTPGASLYWRPTVQPWEHHRSNDRLSCNTASSARYFVGIDIAPASGDEFRVSVRALDVSTAAWVTGFGKTWHGRLSRRQQQALAERRMDEYLRGLRVLPFLDGETDLVAAYLAQNLSCLLREQGAADYRVFLEQPAGSKPNLQKVLTLVSHNLAQHQTVQITERAEDAELILSGSLNDIDGSLHQLWVTVRAKTSDTDLTSIDTGAYIYLGRPAGNQLARAPVESKSMLRSLRSQRTAVLSKLRVLKTRDAESCVDEGYYPLAAHDAVGRGECFLVEFDLYRPAHVLVLSHAVDGTLTRLPQKGCATKDSYRQRWVPRHRVQIAKPNGDGFRWAGRPGIESVYALAVTDSDVARVLATHVNRLPDGCAVDSRNSANANHYRPWLAQLDRLIDRSGGRVDWQAVRVRHAEP